jgi:hypothetical protein
MTGNDAPRQYELKKARILTQFKEALAGGASIGLGKKTSNLFRYRTDAKRLIDVTDLNAVISVDEQNLTA